MQDFGVVQETLPRAFKFFPACGADIAVQCFPSQSTIRGFSAKDFADVPVATVPTAMQN